MSNLESGYQGALTPNSTASEFNALSFIFKQILSKTNTATLVKVISCTNSGGVSPVGFVNVQPLVNQVDGFGNAVPHGIINNIPYMRIQGGANAIIIDPQPNDIGICIFADRDISTVKATKAQANPASARKFDYSDGLYMGGYLNGTPTQYIQMNSSGITVLSPNAVNITASTSANVTAPAINLGASGQTLESLMNSIAATVFNNHVHTDPQGGTTSAPTTTIGATGLTSTVKAG